MKRQWISVTFGVVLALWAACAGAKDRVMIVGAHPDDIIPCLGFCHMAKDIFELHVVDMTHGERGLGPTGYADGSTRKIRIKEEESVCATINAKLHWLDEIDGEAHAGKETCERLSNLLYELKPRAVITMWPLDVNTDHVMAGAATIRAICHSGLQPELWFMHEEYNSKAFPYDVLVDITTVYDQAMASLALYACQSRDGTTEMRRSCAASFWGMQSRHFWGGKAEAYKSFFPLQQGEKTIFSELPQPQFKYRYIGIKRDNLR